MKKFLALFAIALALLAGCTQYNYGNGAPNYPAGNTSVNTTPPAQGATTEIVMQGFAFSPAQITIKKGSTVRWTNHDPAPHTVEADDRSQFASGTLAQNGFFEHTFNESGTYTYHCAIHTTMKGTIIVQ